MILNFKHEANWECIRKRKQKFLEKNNQAENAKRTPHMYRIGDQVLIRRGTENKYETPYNGPYAITKVNENGTVRIRVENVKVTYNIRRKTSYIATDDITHGEECNMRNSGLKGED